jgi:hypothetical protein
VKLYDLSIESLAHHTGSPTSAGDLHPPPLFVRHGTPFSGPPRPQLVPHRASLHCLEAPRPLLHHPRPPERHSRRSPPPPAALSSPRRHYKLPQPDPDRPQMRENSVMLSHPSTLAAGDRHCRNRPVKPLSPPLTMAKDHGLKASKTQGVVCKAKTHMNSAERTPCVICAVNFEISYQFREKS